MTTGFIQDHIPRRMEALGYSRWEVEFRSVLAAPAGTIEVSAWNSRLFFPSDYLVRNYQIEIESDAGMLTAGTATYAEQQWEHFGLVQIKSATTWPQHVHFIEVTPTSIGNHDQRH